MTELVRGPSPVGNSARWVTLLAGLGAACTGHVAPHAPDPDEAPRAGASASPSSGGRGGTQDVPAVTGGGKGISAGPSKLTDPLRRLSAREYANTVLAAFPGLALPALALPPDEILAGEAPGSSGLLAPAHIDELADAAELVADAAIKVPHATLTPCASAPDDAGCMPAYLTALAPTLWRRPITSDERDAVITTVYQPAKGDGRDVARSAAIQAMLTSPHFLYKVESGTADAPVRGAALAARLSYFLWQGPPDAPLLARAMAGELERPDALATEVRRMVADPRAVDVWWRFVSQWLDLARVELVSKDPTLFKGFDDQRKQSLLSESRAFVAEAFRQSGGSLRELLAADYTFANDDLAAFYGLPAPNARELRRVSTPPSRAGILTQGAWLAGHANADEAGVILRGVGVLDAVLCVRPPPPPPMAETQRDVDRLVTQPCASCHTLIDPLGATFGGFDAIGRWDPSHAGMGGAVKGTDDLDGAYPSAAALAKSLAGSRQVAGCAARQLLWSALGRHDSRLDDEALAPMRDALAAGDGLTEAALRLATSTTFQSRRHDVASCQ